MLTTGVALETNRSTPATGTKRTHSDGDGVSGAEESEEDGACLPLDVLQTARATEMATATPIGGPSSSNSVLRPDGHGEIDRGGRRGFAALGEDV